MEIVEYKNLEWYVINETKKEKLLFLKDSFTTEQVLKYFTDNNMVKEYCDISGVKYSKLNSPWYKDSYIREVLNTMFLNDLDKNELNIMRTTLALNNETRISEDYVRLITVNEMIKLPEEILKVAYVYWTMTPAQVDDNIETRTQVFCIEGIYSEESLSRSSVVHGAYAVRPIISLKPECLKSEAVLEESDEIKKAILKFRKRTKG